MMNHADFAVLAQAQKAIARRNQTVRNLVYLAGVLLGLTTGALWLVLWPQQGPSPQDKLGVGVIGGLALSVVCLAWPHALFRQTAKCPACGCNWEIKEGRSAQASEQMPNWSACPGCGMEIGDGVLRRQKAK